MFYFYPEKLPCLSNNGANKEKYILLWPPLLFAVLLSSSPVRNLISSLITNSSTFSPFSPSEKSLKLQLPFTALPGHSAKSDWRLCASSLPTRATPRASRRLQLRPKIGREAIGRASAQPGPPGPLLRLNGRNSWNQSISNEGKQNKKKKKKRRK